ncbi:glucosidase II beta subunit-like domain-containing protein [Trichoderma breve]|uniref:Glucosidase 2 subunit beta n=1 Tax=Trichoderma breve TaxID=2034170 RepID=A0A9W9BEZ8_9HYPO|nr:glucosidase II beta subunit-like domain-containing protein [Trichoderma breve]KAJ4862088.1 glucosidase II beta subunit-like domain-containing protein [Trichoderma breve]
MQHPKSLALLSVMCSLTVAAAGSVPRGVGPEFISHYQNKEFACIANPSIVISIDRVNDNTCDCPDGSDEPGTAACAFIDPLSPEQPLYGSPSGTTNATRTLPGFWCNNKGHIGAYIPFTFVNDGICDYDVCCDGSDENGSANGVKCENRCAAIGKEYRRLAEERKKAHAKAIVKKQEMIKQASELRQQAEARVTALEKDVKDLEVKKEELEREYARVQNEEAGKIVRRKAGAGGKLGVLLGLAKDRVEELREALRLVTEDREIMRGKKNELEAILAQLKQDHDPNSKDEVVNAAVKSFEDWTAREASADQSEFLESDINEILKEDDETNGVNWKAFEEHQDDTDILYDFDAYIPPFIRDVLHDKIRIVRKWLISNGMMADPAADGSESSAVKAAREAAEGAAQELSHKSRELEQERSDLQKDFGPSDIFRAIQGKCAEIDAGEYTYELCWLDKTLQKSKKGHASTNMGNYARIDIAIADEEDRVDGKSLGSGPRMVMRYENGQTCWNGPQRRTDVWLGCAETEEIWRVSEAEKCVYKLEVGTPAACEDETVKKSHEKDEL